MQSNMRAVQSFDAPHSPVPFCAAIAQLRCRLAVQPRGGTMSARQAVNPTQAKAATPLPPQWFMLYPRSE